MEDDPKWIARQEAEALKRGKEAVMRKLKEQAKKAKRAAIRKILVAVIPYLAYAIAIIVGILVIISVLGVTVEFSKDSTTNSSKEENTTDEQTTSFYTDFDEELKIILAKYQ